MERKSSEILQALIFLGIFIGNIFLASRYWAREDVIGTSIFVLVFIASGVAFFGHFMEWWKVR